MSSELTAAPDSPLPILPARVRRLHQLKWTTLCAKLGFAGEHIKWHDSTERRRQAARPQVSLSPPPANLASNRHHSLHTYYGREGEEISFEKWKQLQMADWAARQNDQEFVDRIGIWETVSLAKQRFSQLAGDYVSFWSQRRGANSDIANRWLDGVRQLVVSETASLWAGTEWHSSWFERACRSKVLEGLGPLVQEWTSRVVELEIQHLQNPSIPLRSIVAAGGNLGIARQYDEAYRTISASRDLIKGYRRAHFGVADLGSPLRRPPPELSPRLTRRFAVKRKAIRISSETNCL